MTLNLKNELSKLKIRFDVLSNDYLLENTIEQILKNIKEWRSSNNANVYDVMPIIPELVGYYSVEKDRNNVSIVEDFVSISESSKNNQYSYGFQDGNIFLMIPPISLNFYNNIFCYQYHDNFIDKLNVNNLKLKFVSDTFDIDNSSTSELTSIQRSLWLNAFTMISISINIRSCFVVFIYIYNEFKKIKEVERINYDKELNITFKNKYSIFYDLDGITKIIDEHNIEVFSKTATIDNGKYLLERIFSKINVNGKENLNKYLLKLEKNTESIEKILKLNFSDLDFNELEEVLEFIYPIYELPKDIRFIEYINDELDIKFIDWSNLNKFLIILQNVVQDLVDDF